MNKRELSVMSPGRVKVRFDLPRDNDEWPPANAEYLWATKMAGDLVKLENIPFFARGVAQGDVIHTRVNNRGEREAGETVIWSGHCAIRIISMLQPRPVGDLKAILDEFAPLGVSGEGFGRLPIVALDVPPDADLSAVKQLLLRGERDGRWDYEEGCVGDAWCAAEPDGP